jgi:hypothetical protein
MRISASCSIRQCLVLGFNTYSFGIAALIVTAVSAAVEESLRSHGSPQRSACSPSSSTAITPAPLLCSWVVYASCALQANRMASSVDEYRHAIATFKPSHSHDT